jgi:hypothetical protein
MVAIHLMYYNFGRIHKTLRVTPAMAAGLADHVWNLEEIVFLAKLTVQSTSIKKKRDGVSDARPKEKAQAFSRRLDHGRWS